MVCITFLIFPFPFLLLCSTLFYKQFRVHEFSHCAETEERPELPEASRFKSRPRLFRRTDQRGIVRRGFRSGLKPFQIFEMSGLFRFRNRNPVHPDIAAGSAPFDERISCRSRTAVSAMPSTMYSTVTGYGSRLTR